MLQNPSPTVGKEREVRKQGKLNHNHPPHSSDLYHDVIDLICSGVSGALGANISSYTREIKFGSVVTSAHWTVSSDYSSSVAKDIFHKKGCVRKESKSKLLYIPFSASVTSEHGLVREYTYTHPRDLAKTIVLHMDEVKRCLLVGSININDLDGMISIVTKTHLNWHLVHNRIPCHICSNFLKGIRGLRCHQILVHGIDYERAQREAAESNMWVIVYEPPIQHIPSETPNSNFLPIARDIHPTANASTIKTENGHSYETEKSSGGFRSKSSSSSSSYSSSFNRNSGSDHKWSLLNAERLIKVAEDAIHNKIDEGIMAAKSGDLKRLKDLVEHYDWDAHNTVDKYGSTAFFWACGEGRLGVCKYLYHSCNINIHEMKGKEGMKRHALHWAGRNGHIDVAAWLIHKLQVDPDIGTEDGTTALHFACYNGKLDICKYFLEQCNGCVNINKLNSYGCNASQWLSLRGDVESMKYFLSVGLDFKILNRNGHSALHKAAIKGNMAACIWLLTPEQEGGAGLGLEHMQPDDDNFTPMLFATANGHSELGRILNKFYEEM